MCLSWIGGNVFARSGRKTEEMGSDKFRFFNGCVSRLKAGGETRLLGSASRLMGSSAALSAQVGQQTPHEADRKGGNCSFHLRGQLGGKH